LPLDGELWLGRKMFQRTVSIVRRHDEPDSWRQIRFVVFDAPDNRLGFERRLENVDTIVRANCPAFAVIHEHIRCTGKDHLHRALAGVESLGGEGLMLRQSGSFYTVGRSATLLKVKRFLDSEARVVGHEPGKGRHKGRLGALLVELTNGTRFAVGTGLTDADRSRPPAIGRTIMFRYQELTDGGVPRFPSFVRVHD
jgi:DNA ligase-1